METLHVDCGRCALRGKACSDCVISVLLGVPDDRPVAVDLVPDERAALAALAGSGLVPPLRLVESVSIPDPEFLPIRSDQRRRAGE